MKVFSSSAQQYPKKIVLDKDTVICFLPIQLTAMNNMVVSLYECREERVGLLNILSKSDSLVNSKDKEIKSLEEMNENVNERLKIKDSEIGSYKDLNNSLNKKIKRGRTNIIIQRVIIGILIGTITFIKIKG